MSLSYTVPTPGSTLNSVADPEVASALNAILTWANGSIQGDDLAPAAQIANSQLGVDAKRLSYRSASTNTSANPGDLIVGGAALTVTLPAPTLNAVVGVFCGEDGAIVTATVSSGQIVMLGSTVSSLSVGRYGAFVILQGNGASWLVVGGDRDSGWLPLSLPTGVQAGSGYVPAVRLRGDIVHLKGSVYNNTGGVIAAGAEWASLPTGVAPSETLYAQPSAVGAGAWENFTMSIAPSGVLALPGAGLGAGYTLYLDGISYSLS